METTIESSNRPVGTGPAEAEPVRPLDSKTADGSDAPPEAAAAAPLEADDGEPPPAESASLDELTPDRRRIEEQLEALKRREFQLRRELAMADHPALAEAIRVLEGCVYSVSRADEKLAQGLTKSEQRRQETLGKKIASLTEKRDALDAQIEQLRQELSSQGQERMRGFETERREAMERLVAALGKHGGALQEADLEATELLPQIGAWMDEIRGVAEQLVAARG